MAKGDKPPRSEPRVLDPLDAKLLSQQASAGERAAKRDAANARLAEEYASLRLGATPSSATEGPSLARRSWIPSALSSFYKGLSPEPDTSPAESFAPPLFPIYWAFNEYVMHTLWVNGPSMTPYLNEDWPEMHTQRDLLLMNSSLWTGFPWNTKVARLERGMVVSFQSPANPSNVAVKRIIGLPGDRITTRGPSLKPSMIVPFNHVWVEGDAEDPSKSLDSNTYGPRSQGSGRERDGSTGEIGMQKKSNDSAAENYRQSVRDRVQKGAVEIQRPMLAGQWS
ncbi:peptidase S24/S26A/S26B/S26C [Penicillium chermesinum]|nr:peptidase S24/S26A/S26B/S26C [Penicillium chermesinum]